MSPIDYSQAGHPPWLYLVRFTILIHYTRTSTLCQTTSCNKILARVQPSPVV